MSSDSSWSVSSASLEVSLAGAGGGGSQLSSNKALGEAYRDCECCTFFQRKKGKKRVRMTLNHSASKAHKSSAQIYELWQQHVAEEGEFYTCRECANANIRVELTAPLMKRHVNEHLKGLHIICEPCSFFQELMGKPPVLSVQKHDERVKHKREKEIFNAWKVLQIEGSIVNGFTCTKCATAQGDQNPEHRTFKYDDMRKHVFEHGRGDHSHCKECSFFEELQGKPP